MKTHVKEYVLVSACLMGINCRWHGKKVSVSGYIKKLLKEESNIILIPVCPEMLGGLPVPRPPAKRKGGKVFETCPEKENRKNVTGLEITDKFENGALQVLRRAVEFNCKRAILCKYSPSCDKSGITGKLLTEHGIEIINTF